MGGWKGVLLIHIGRLAASASLAKCFPGRESRLYCVVMCCVYFRRAMTGGFLSSFDSVLRFEVGGANQGKGPSLIFKLKRAPHLCQIWFGKLTLL